MKPKTDHSYCFKFLALSLLTLATSSLAIAQTRPPQNIRRVTVTSQYVFENGKKTDKFWAIYQEIYDSLGRLHTEISYDFTDHYPHNYIWHTFKGMQKVKSEIFKNEKLQTIEEFTYNTDSLLTKKVVKRVSPNDTSIFYTLNYRYDSKRNPIEISATSGEGKKAFISKSTYDIKGKELTRKVKVKKNYFPQDSILKLVSIPVYDSIGRLVGERLTINKVDRPTIQKNFKYSYDKNSNQIGIVELDERGKQVLREEKIYQQNMRHRLSVVKYFDTNDIMVKMIAKRYEIYRTNDHWGRELEY